jgi:plastocyanin
LADILQAPAGGQVTVTYTNNSSVPHNWHLFNGADTSAPSIAQTTIQAGPDAQSVQFTAPPQAGQYYYQCDVHPFMNGHLVVTPP